MMDQAIALSLYHWVNTSAFLTQTTVLIAQDGIVLLPLVPAALWFVPRQGTLERRGDLLACVLALVLALVFVGVLSLLFDRPRP